MQSVSSWAPKVVRKCESKHWLSCGADGRSVYGHVITKFLGWVDLLCYGAPPTRARSARVELRYYGGAPRAKRTSEAPLVCKSTHTRKFSNHVTVHRPSVRTTGEPMFNFTLSSSFGSLGKLILHTYCTSMCDQLTAVKTGYLLTSIT